MIPIFSAELIAYITTHLWKPSVIVFGGSNSRNIAFRPDKAISPQIQSTARRTVTTAVTSFGFMAVKCRQKMIDIVFTYYTENVVC